MSAAAAALPRPKEFAFDASDHAAIATLVYEQAGILLPPAKAQLVYGRLARRVRARGLATFAEYIRLLQEDGAELAQAVDALTTNHTSFFREQHHFDHFVGEYWPALNARLASGGRVRLWSAACSSGEEPYTLLMALLGTERNAARDLARRDFRLLATDLSREILATAKAGRYAKDSANGIPAALKASWFDRVGDDALIRDEIRSLVEFRQLNLLGDWPMRQKFDAIFCRNVMIYFDEPTKARLQSRLADQLADQGFLYIGHSERLSAGVADRFACVGRTIYQKVKP